MKPQDFSTDTATPPAHPGLGFREFVAFIAAIMALNAISIDSMLPALPQIAQSLGITQDNQVQWVITAYLLGFGGAQIIYGPLADRYGRKPVLMFGIALYTAASLWVALSTTFETIIVARIIQGVGAAATRVLAVSIVRDCYSGSVMARVMSLVFIVFLAAPIVAPSIGQAIIVFVSWHWIFGFLAAYGILTMFWGLYRLPETLHPEDRMPISARAVSRAFALTVTTRQSIFYTLAATLLMGCLFSFINTAQQVFADVFEVPNLFTTIFAGIALFMAASNFLNSRVVVKMGPRRVSHTALFGFTSFAILHMVSAVSGFENLIVFSLLQGGMMFCFGLMISNFNSLAMEPMGHIAGTAASVQGFITTTGGALLGFLVGQHFDMTTVPLGIGFSIYSLMAIICLLIAEKGRLFGGVAPARGA